MVKNKKRIALGIIKLIIFLTIIIICLVAINEITKRKSPYLKYEDFFSQKENFDVLFFRK